MIDHNHIEQRDPEVVVDQIMDGTTDCPACRSIDPWHLTRTYLRQQVGQMRSQS